MKHYNVCIVLDDSLDRNDGVQQYVRTLGTWLENAGHNVDYLVGETRSSRTNVISLARNISIQFNGNRLTIPFIASRKRIKSILQAKKYDIIHVQMPYSPLLAGRVLKFANNNTAIVATFHILPFSRLHVAGTKLLGIFQRKSLARIEKVISVSQPAKDFASTIFGVDSVVIPNAINTRLFISDTENIKGRIIFLGRLVKRKGCRQLILAYSALPHSTRSNSELIIVGDGPLRNRLQQLCLDNSLDNVRFVGSVSEKQKVKLLASSSIAVFPSLSGESFGIVLLEAIAAGSGIVLGGNNPGYHSVLKEWPSAIFDPHDTQQLSRMLSRYLIDIESRVKISDSQRQTVKQYDIKNVGPKIIEIYRQAIAINAKANHNNQHE